MLNIPENVPLVTPHNGILPVLQFPSTIVSVESCGHQFAINLTDFFIVLAFQLHGQVVVCNNDIFEEIYHNTHYINPVAWQMAIKLEDIQPQPTVLLFVDYNRLMRIELRMSNTPKWGPKRNVDAIDDWPRYKMTILRALPSLRNRHSTIFYVISKEELFNGFGANHTTEALHYAMIHPMYLLVRFSEIGNSRIVSLRDSFKHLEFPMTGINMYPRVQT